MSRKRKPAWEDYAAAFADRFLEQLLILASGGGGSAGRVGERAPKQGARESRAGRDGPYFVLGVLPGAPLDVCEAVYRARAKRAHPDHGGDPGEFRKLTEAIEALRRREGR